MTGLSVLFVPLLERLLRGRSVPRRVWIGVALAAIGLGILTQPFGGAVGPDVHLGDVLTAGCAVAFSFQILFIAESSSRHPLGLFTAVQLATCTLCSTLVLPFDELRLVVDWELVWVVAYLGLVNTTLCFILQNWAQRHTTASRAAVLFTMEPVFAALVSNIFGGEALGPHLVIGGALIVGGILAVELARGPKAPM